MGSATVQGELWGAAAADWAELQEPTVTPLWGALLDALGVAAHTQFLDAGCGAGGASALAARCGAMISGLDAAAALIAIARERVPKGDFRVGELEALPYADGAFDAILAVNAIQYAADPVAALRELRRVCAADGRVGVATWGSPEYCEMRAVFTAMRSTLPNPPTGGGPFALSAPGALEGLLAEAGIRALRSGEADCPFVYPDIETYWRAQRSAGSFQAALRVVDERQLKAAVVQAAEPYRSSAGGVRLMNRFRFVVGMP